MKNIEPLNPDVKPDEPTPTPTPPPPAEANQAQITPSQNDVPLPVQPTILPPATESARSTEAIYPTPLSSEERLAHEEEIDQARKQAFKFPVSQFLLPLIVGLYALYLVVEILKSFFSGGTALYTFYTFTEGGTFSKLVWFELLSSFIMLVIVVILCYKIFRGSKIALALLTAPLVVYIQNKLTIYLVALTDMRSASIFNDSPLAIGQLLAEVVVLTMLVLAWTKDKKYYS